MHVRPLHGTAWICVLLAAVSSCGKRQETPAPPPPVATAAPETTAAPLDATPAPPPDTARTRPEFDYRAHVGVGRFAGEGRVCLEIDNARLVPGELVLLISPLARAFPSAARVVAGAGDSCASAGADPEASHYTLKLVQGAFDEEDIAIALAGEVPTPRIHNGVLSADLDGDGEAETFHACTAAESVHLTIWTGAPGSGQRRWHREVRTPPNLRPGCTEPETAPDPAPVKAPPPAAGG